MTNCHFTVRAEFWDIGVFGVGGSVFCCYCFTLGIEIDSDVVTNILQHSADIMVLVLKTSGTTQQDQSEVYIGFLTL